MIPSALEKNIHRKTFKYVKKELISMNSRQQRRVPVEPLLELRKNRSSRLFYS